MATAKVAFCSMGPKGKDGLGIRVAVSVGAVS